MLPGFARRNPVSDDEPDTMRTSLRTAALAVAVSVLAGSVLVASASPALPACETPRFSFEQQRRIGTGNGYEPGIEIDSKGNIWTTAHKLSLVREEGTRLSSFLHRSTNDGVTFSNVENLVPGQHPLYALEGDLAVDGEDRMYFVDTWAADNHFYRFGPDGQLESVRPLVPTAEIDDRPWLAAHHDGYVYYMSNTGLTPTGRLTIHRSTDRGESFDAGFLMEGSGWGFIDADPNSSYVYAVANDAFYGGGEFLEPAKSMHAWWSPDHGETWNKVKIADYQHGYNVTNDHHDGFPSVAVSPADGSVYALWTDNGRKLLLGRSTDRGASWDVHDVTPFQAYFSYAWVTVGAGGDVGISFEARLPNEGVQRIWAMQWRPEANCEDPETSERCTGPASVAARVNLLSVGASHTQQADFFQTEIASTNGRQHVVWTGSSYQLYHARTNEAPSMDGTSYCGHHVL